MPRKALNAREAAGLRIPSLPEFWPSSVLCHLFSGLVKSLFFNSGCLSSEFAQIVDFGASHAAPGNDLDFINDR